MKKALVIRCGAYGDMLIISPLFRALKKEGYHVILHTGKRGIEVLQNNPFIDEYIEYTKEGQANDNVEKEWDELKERINPDWFKNFAESIEVSISLHPCSPAYNLPKWKRAERCNKNFYEATAEYSGLPFDRFVPDIFITDEEKESSRKYLKEGKKNILWCLSGSGSNKAYPWADYVIGELLNRHDDLHFITVGDEKCKILEGMIDEENITHLAGEIPFRTSMVLTSIVDLVISPDTGVLHASGAFDTPKIGLLGHTTKTNVTKHFKNDFSLESNPELAECSPCFRLIYDHKIQCPIDNLSGAAWCMAEGLPSKIVAKQIEAVLYD